MNNIGDNISKAIKEGKWLRISYINQQDENTFYWISVKDINFDTKKLFVSIFNETKSLNVLESWISFEGIKSAEVLNFTSYDVPDKLINKIEANLEKCGWLNYDHFDHNILNYYKECNFLDNDPYQKEAYAIAGIDLQKLKNERTYQLNDEQIKKIIADIYHYDINNITNTFYTLIVNRLSINIDKKRYVVCYNVLTFDPNKKSLILDETLRFNYSFLIEGRKHNLLKYINMDIEEFTKNFEERYDEYRNLILENLGYGEKINELPEIMLLQRDLTVDLTEVYDSIEEKYKSKQLPVPLKAFFGSISSRNKRKKDPSLIIFDDKINIDQMRVLYNAIKNPITYVQGPPGTGKTQTIINVVLSAFFNDMTMLICSSNNKPVDSIVEKLKFEYKEEKTQFPFLRLGNIEDVKKATLKIRELYNFTTTKEPKEHLLHKIKVTTDDKNSRLKELIEKQENRIKIEYYIENAEKFLKLVENSNSKIVRAIKTRIEQLKIEKEKYPEVTNEELFSLYTPFTDDPSLKQFLYFKSLQYIFNLKKPRYKELINICNIKDDDERVQEFNIWSQNDDNIKLLTEVFPIIFSTNISSKRLGGSNFTFDLVIMDEAGQCNIATALIPISKANSLLLVGDPNQLKPVVILEHSVNKELMKKYNVSDKYNYKTKSIFETMRENDNVSEYILLKYHYRCAKKIISFSNHRYYNNLLNLSYIKSEGDLKLLDVKNKNNKNKNEALDEALEIANYIQRNNIKDAYIVTPFVNQKELLQDLLTKKGITGVECGTIHSLQGAEKDTIIFSTALTSKTSKKTFEWIKNNAELINVAVTRAKEKLIISADTEVLNKLSSKDDDLYYLVNYVKNNGNLVIPLDNLPKAEIGKSNGSNAEDEFYQTLSHFCTCYENYEVERNVSLKKIFPKENFSFADEYEFDAVLYEKTVFKKSPKVIFEINGPEHFGNMNREKSDRLKVDIAKRNNVKIVFIPNTLVKAYEYIINIIVSSKKIADSIQQSFFD